MRVLKEWKRCKPRALFLKGWARLLGDSLSTLNPHQITKFYFEQQIVLNSIASHPSLPWIGYI